MLQYLQKYIVLILFLMLLPLFGMAQQLSASVPQWVIDVGGNGDSCKVIAQKIDASNNIYVTGFFTGTVDFDPSAAVKNLTSLGNTDVFIAKYDTNGSLLWAYAIGGSGNEQPNGLAIDVGGNVTITGQYNSPTMDANPGAGVNLLTNAGGNDMFLINLDSNGNFLWANSIGGTGQDVANGVAIDPGGNRIMVGQFQSTLTTGGINFTSSGTANGLCAKYNSAGNLLWAFSLGQTGDNGIRSVATDANGNVIIAGAFNGTVNFNPLGTPNNQTSAGTASYIAQYSSAGQLIWLQQIAGNIPGYQISMYVDQNNNIFATGPFTAKITFSSSATLTSKGAQDVFLARYNSAGVFQFANDIARGNTAVTTSTSKGICVGSDGNVYVIGYFSGNVNFDPGGSLNLPDHSKQDLFIAKYTSSGLNWWANNAGNGNNCGNVAGLSITLDSKSNIILAGSFCSTVNFDFAGCSNYDLTSKSATSDGFLAKYIPGSSLAENNVISTATVGAICGGGVSGGITGSVAFNGVGPPVYQWQSSVDSVTFTNITGITTQNYNPPVSTSIIYYRRSATSGACYQPVFSNVVKVAVQPALNNNVITSPASSVFCAGGNPNTITGTTPTGGDGTNYAYQWQSSVDSITFTNISGATTINYTPMVLIATTYFQRLVTSGACITPQGSNIIKITIQPALANNILTAPTVTYFCTNGTPGIINGATPTGGNGSYKYQWQSSADSINYMVISGANLANYTPPTINVTTYYQRSITSGVCSTPLVSNAIKITVQPAIINNSLTAPPVTDFCTSGQPNIIIGSLPSGGNGALTYQWQISTDSVNFTNIPGITTKDYSPPTLYNITYYQRVVSSGLCSQASNVITIIIQTPIVNNIITLSNTSCFFSGSTPTGGNGHFTYQWQSSTDGVTFANINGATSINYSPPLTTITIYYRRIVMSGTCYPASTGNAVVVTVNAIISNNLITAPASVLICAGTAPGTVIGNIPSGGNGSYIYQWQSSTDNINFSDVTGATSKDYQPTLLTIATYFRRVVISGYCLTPSISSVIMIQVQPALNNNTIVASGVSSFCVSGQPAVINGSTPSGGDGNTYSYQWQMSTDSINYSSIAGATAIDYGPPFLTVTTYYRRLIISGVCTVPFSSNTVTIQIQPALANNVVIAPAVTIFCLTGIPSAITGNTPTGGSGIYNYQWQNSPDNITFTNIAGANAISYNPAQINKTTYYRRIVTSGACTAPLTSNVTQLLVYSLPVVATSPDVSICPGTNTTLSASGGISYQWSPATGLSDPTIANPIANPLTTTNYTVSVFNGGCSVNASVTVTVVQPPVVNAGTELEIVKGKSIQLNGSVTGSVSQYYWLPVAYLSDPKSLNPIAMPPTDITYKLYAISANNCFTVSDSVFVKVYSNLFIPNSFTPNGDGINDVWDIPALAAYANCQLYVYNRYGSLVLKTTGYPKSWDGTYNGKQLPAGTYYYTLDLKDGSKILSGWVAIIR